MTTWWMKVSLGFVILGIIMYFWQVFVVRRQRMISLNLTSVSGIQAKEKNIHWLQMEMWTQFWARTSVVSVCAGTMIFSIGAIISILIK